MILIRVVIVVIVVVVSKIAAIHNFCKSMRYKPGQKASVGLCYDDLTDQSLDSQLMAQLQLSVAYASFLVISKSNEKHNTSTTMQAVFFLTLHQLSF
jgi:hypothetical protein